MKKVIKKILENRKTVAEFVGNDNIRERLLFTATHSLEEVFNRFASSESGISETYTETARDEYGKNIITRDKKDSLLKRICNAFINPFTAILFVLAIVSIFTDVVFAEPGEQSYVTFIIITTMVMISGILRFVQETRSGNAAAKLSKMIHTTTCVERAESGEKEIALDDVVVGDIIHLSAGDMVLADVRILSSKDLFVS